ncbi:MAG TPA: HNH endonuclease signature motif containing protein [Acidovorax defluvii]|jgi:hypothetical protein|nr:HNH endonuclease signature motif containing protein [Acidovorax defluvii]HQS65523.1 HNH endonuclease signature motif containing protein [Acidovorax defluvii]
MTIIYSRLVSLLEYDPMSGLFTWRAKRAPDIKPGDVAGTLRSDGYTAIRIDGAKYQAHRLAWLYVFGTLPSGQIDHFNGVRSDNRIANLRIATNSENCRNRPKRADNTSGFKGVSFEASSGKWRANAADSEGKWRSLGRHKTPEMAHAAYEKFTTEQHGNFKYQGAPA